jgi:hypothetical protein
MLHLLDHKSPQDLVVSDDLTMQNSIQLFIIYVLSQQLQGQLQTQHSVTTTMMKTTTTTTTTTTTSTTTAAE